jgi:hypothetical protein
VVAALPAVALMCGAFLVVNADRLVALFGRHPEG